MRPSRFSRLILSIGLLAPAGAVPLRSIIPSTISNITALKEPCLQITALADRAVRLNTTFEPFDGELAYRCLTSMPFDARNGAQFVRELRKFVEWQSTLDVLKRPLSEYLSPAVDILAGLDDIQERASQDQYESQYEFDSAIVTLLQSANEGHLSAGLCSTSIFRFQVDLDLVSTSRDGVQTPQIYTSLDAELQSQGSKAVSPVVVINGQPAAEALEIIASLQPYQDPDARYNQLFAWPARLVADQSPKGAFSNRGTIWPGQAQQELQFANGTILQTKVMATINIEDFNYRSGHALLKDRCLPRKDTPVTAPGGTASADPSPAPSMYPEAQVRNAYNKLSGYYLDEDDLQEVAVLFIPAFDPPSGSEFADQATEFVTAARAANKTKIILDLTFNQGGFVNSGYDLFRLFFPDQDIYAASRFRATEQGDLAGHALDALDPTTDPACQGAMKWCLASWVGVDQAPNKTHHFDKWSDVFGPVKQFGGEMSALVAPLDLNTSSSPDGPIRGYGEVDQFPLTRLFEPDNILIVTDGSCTSTCTIFAELLKNQANIKTLTFGGRPHPGPMQGIGGSKGSQVLNLAEVIQLGESAMQHASSDPHMYARLGDLFPQNRTERFPFIIDGSSTKINYRSAYRRGNDDLPLQFTYEAADCRRFYTWENVVRPGSLWVDAARAWWSDRENGCVKGHTD